MPARGAPAERRRRLAATLLIGVLLCLAGCRPESGWPAGGSVSPGQFAAARATVAALTRAVLAHDGAAFDRQISVRDPQFAVTADLMFANLTSMPLTSLALSLPTSSAPSAAPARTRLAPAAYVAPVRVVWRVAGDLGPAEHLLWITFLPLGSKTRIAGITAGPTEDTPQPLWLLEPLTSSRVGPVTVLGGRGRPVEHWVRAALSAEHAVRRRVPAPSWNGRLVVEAPATAAAFERVLGGSGHTYDQLAAVARPEGPRSATAAVRIVLNPDLVGRLDPQTLTVLLTHEATHLATRSASSPAPLWLVEGYADYVAYEAQPSTAGRAAAALLARVRASGAPTALPGNSAFTPDAEDLALRYAEAWLACRYLAQRYSPSSLWRFYAEVDAGVAVAEALESVFGLDEAHFTADWASSLQGMAARGQLDRR